MVVIAIVTAVGTGRVGRQFAGAVFAAGVVIMVVAGRVGRQFAAGGGVIRRKHWCIIADMMPERTFTLAEADALVPWLEQRFAAMQPLRDALAESQETLLALLQRRRSNGHSSSESEIAAAQDEAARLTGRLQEAVAEITRRGILVRDIGRGLVDFPSWRDGAVVYLCWQRGEPAIAWWHPTDTGFGGRQRL